MAVVITFAQQKGGAGKTSLAVHLATAWHHLPLSLTQKAPPRITLVDLDPQESLSSWYALREQQGLVEDGLSLRTASGWGASSEIARAQREADIVVIDTPPHMEPSLRLGVRHADMVIVPCQLSPMDVWASHPTLDLIGRERRPALVVLNRVPPRARLADELAVSLKQDKLPLARVSLGNRIAYASSLMQGKGVLESMPFSAAAAETRLLAGEIMRRLGHRVYPDPRLQARARAHAHAA